MLEKFTGIWTKFGAYTSGDVDHCLSTYLRYVVLAMPGGCVEGGNQRGAWIHCVAINTEQEPFKATLCKQKRGFTNKRVNMTGSAATYDMFHPHPTYTSRRYLSNETRRQCE